MRFSDVRFILYCQCHDSSLLASESLDRELTFTERWAMRLHHLVCSRCHRVARQLRRLHAAVAEMPSAVRRAMLRRTCELSPTAKARIIDAMHGSSP